MAEVWGPVDGSCHCGAVQIRVAALPDELNDCQCEHCQKRGALWAYYSRGDVQVTGTTLTYCWGDREIDFHFCGQCGCTTHYTIIDPGYDRVGVNARVFGKAVFHAIPQRKGAGPS